MPWSGHQGALFERMSMLLLDPGDRSCLKEKTYHLDETSVVCVDRVVVERKFGFAFENW